MAQESKQILLTDFDGVLVPFQVWVDACRSVLKSCSLRVADSLIVETIMSQLEIVQDHFQINPTWFIKEVLAYVDARIDEIRLQEGVLDTLSTLTRRGVSTGIVTSSGRYWPERILQNNGAQAFIHTIIPRDHPEVAKRKPHPDPIYQALKELDGRADQAIMVGDRKGDIDAAGAAGVLSVAFYSDENQRYCDREQLDKMKADCVIYAFPEVISFF